MTILRFMYDKDRTRLSVWIGDSRGIFRKFRVFGYTQTLHYRLLDSISETVITSYPTVIVVNNRGVYYD